MVALPLVDADAPGRGTSPEVSIILAPRSRGSRRAVGREPQAQSLPRPLRLVAEIFPADPGALHQLDPAGQDAVRLRLTGDHAGRGLSDFAKLEIREEIRPKVLKANARRLLNI